MSPAHPSLQGVPFRGRVTDRSHFRFWSQQQLKDTPLPPINTYTHTRTTTVARTSTRARTHRYHQRERETHTRASHLVEVLIAVSTRRVFAAAVARHHLPPLGLQGASAPLVPSSGCKTSSTTTRVAGSQRSSTGAPCYQDLEFILMSETQASSSAQAR